jgi:hypothetical protein
MISPHPITHSLMDKSRSINKVLKTMLQRTVDKHKTNWHHMIFPSLWAYRTTVKTTTCFTPFHLVHDIESILPIECEIPTLRTTIELFPNTPPLEKRLLALESLDEDRRHPYRTMKQPKSGPKPPLTAKLTFGHLPKVTSSSPTISPMILSTMENLNPYGGDPMSSSIALIRVPTS